MHLVRATWAPLFGAAFAVSTFFQIGQSASALETPRVVARVPSRAVPQRGEPELPFREEPAAAEEAAARRLVGEVRAIDTAKALVQVSDTVLRLHPRHLREFVPGQLVTVTYVEVEGNAWLSAVAPVGAPSTGGMAGIGAEDVVPGGPGTGRGAGVPLGSERFMQGSYAVPGYSSEIVINDDLGPLGVGILEVAEYDRVYGEDAAAGDGD